MAVVAPSSSETLDPKPDQSSIEQTQILNQDTSNSTPSSIPPPTSSSLPLVTAAPDNTVPTSNPAIMVPPPPPAPPSFTPSFRPIVSAPQFSPVVNPNIQNPSFQVQNPNLQPPGVSIGGISGAGMVSVTAPPGMQPVGYFSATGQVPGVQPRPYWQAPPNGYMGIQPSAPHGQGFMHPPGGLIFILYLIC